MRDPFHVTILGHFDPLNVCQLAEQSYSLILQSTHPLCYHSPTPKGQFAKINYPINLHAFGRLRKLKHPRETHAVAGQMRKHHTALVIGIEPGKRAVRLQIY